jgi:rhodanese-related sulfurtransferase
VCAFERRWPDPDFIKQVDEEFPDKGVANVEEARALFSSLGYVYLDVRPALELEEVGKVKGSVNVPIQHAKWKYNAEERKRTVVREDNPDFVAQVEKRFPDKETKIMIACSNGTRYSLDALEALDEAGYENLAGLKGGYYAWFNVFDNKLGRRVYGEYQEEYGHDGDSCGIHGSGAGFDRVDAIGRWQPPKEFL